MKKWAFAIAAGVIIVAGCGGGGGGGSSTAGGTGTTSGDSTAFISIPNTPGQLQNVFLTGQGRVAGDKTAVINLLTADDQFGHLETVLNPELRCLLNGYTANAAILVAPTSTTRIFDQYTLNIDHLEVDNGGSTTRYPDAGTGGTLVNQNFPANIRIFPGRQTSVTVRIDDSMFEIDTNGVTFRDDLFGLANFDPISGVMEGRMSDYVFFDISGLGASSQPDLPDGSGKATAFFVSGDNFGMGLRSQPNIDPSAKPLFILTPTGFVEGSHIGERVLGGSGIPGTYTLVQPDPRPPFDPDARITAMMGVYKEFNKTIASAGSGTNGFEIVAFPSAHDDGMDDAVAFTVSGGNITSLYFGFMDLNAGTISLFPVDQLDDPSNTANEVTGSITSLLNGSGGSTTDPSLARSGRYTLNAPNRPANFNASGRFIVYRR